MSMITIPSAIPMSPGDAATLQREPDRAGFIAAAIAEKLARDARMPPPPVSASSAAPAPPGARSRAPSSSGVPSAVPSAVDMDSADAAALGRVSDKAGFIAKAIAEKMARVPAAQYVRASTAVRPPPSSEPLPPGAESSPSAAAPPGPPMS
jgi:hypothetical protein